MPWGNTTDPDYRPFAPEGEKERRRGESWKEVERRARATQETEEQSRLRELKIYKQMCQEACIQFDLVEFEKWLGVRREQEYAHQQVVIGAFNEEWGSGGWRERLSRNSEQQPSTETEQIGEKEKPLLSAYSDRIMINGRSYTEFRGWNIDRRISVYDNGMNYRITDEQGNTIDLLSKSMRISSEF